MIENWKIDTRTDPQNARHEILCLQFYRNFITDEGQILVGGNNPRIQAYSIRNATLEKEMRGHNDSVTCMALDGNLLFTGSDDCTIRQWELTLNSPSGVVGEVEERKYSQDL